MPLTPTARSIAKMLLHDASASGSNTVLLDEDAVADKLGVKRDTVQRALARLRRSSYIDYDPLPPGDGSTKARRENNGSVLRRVCVDTTIVEVAE